MTTPHTWMKQLPSAIKACIQYSWDWIHSPKSQCLARTRKIGAYAQGWRVRANARDWRVRAKLGAYARKFGAYAFLSNFSRVYARARRARVCAYAYRPRALRICVKLLIFIHFKLYWCFLSSKTSSMPQNIFLESSRVVEQNLKFFVKNWTFLPNSCPHFVPHWPSKSPLIGPLYIYKGIFTQANEVQSGVKC